MPGRRCELGAGTVFRGRSEGRDASHAGERQRSPRPRDVGRSPTGSSPARGSGGRWRSSCSSARGSSRVTAFAPRGSPAVTAPSTASSSRSRRWGFRAAGTSWKGWAERSSRSAELWSASGSSGRRRTSRWRRSSWPPPIRPSRTGPHCPGRDGQGRGRRGGGVEPVGALFLAAADPAQPYGAALPWPRRAGARAARVAGAYVVLLGGEPRLFVERGGRTLVPLRDPDPDWLRPALAALVEHVKGRRGVKRLAVERFDGEPLAETDAMPLLLEAGFTAGPRRAVLRP